MRHLRAPSVAGFHEPSLRQSRVELHPRSNRAILADCKIERSRKSLSSFFKILSYAQITVCKMMVRVHPGGGRTGGSFAPAVRLSTMNPGED